MEDGKPVAERFDLTQGRGLERREEALAWSF